MEKKRIYSFEGLRFIFVCFLVLHHFDSFNDLNVNGWDSIMKVFTEGYVSVNFFFVLSGFVISYNYFESLNIDESTKSIKRYLFNRLIHIYPTHVLLLLVTCFIYIGFENFAYILKDKSFYANLLLMQSWIPSTSYYFSYNGLSWSLSTELFFYFAFIFLANLKEKKIELICCYSFTIILFIIIFSPNNIDLNWLLYINPLTRLADFILGIVLYFIYSKRKDKITVKKATILEIVSICVLVIFVIISIYFNISWKVKWQLFYDFPILIIIYAFSFDKGYISNIFKNKVFVFLGSLSFYIYMDHQIILIFIKKIFNVYLINCYSVLLFGVFGLILSIIIGYIIKKVYADPLSKLLKKSLIK